MEFNRVRVAWENPESKLLKSLGEIISLRLKNGNTPEDQIVLRGISC